jgi:hypothetical protein
MSPGPEKLLLLSGATGSSSARRPTGSGDKPMSNERAQRFAPGAPVVVVVAILTFFAVIHGMAFQKMNAMNPTRPAPEASLPTGD